MLKDIWCALVVCMEYLFAEGFPLCFLYTQNYMDMYMILDKNFRVWYSKIVIVNLMHI